MEIRQQHKVCNDLLNDKMNSPVKSLLNRFSIEITTTEARGIADFQTLLPTRTDVYIITTPKILPNDVVHLAERLYQEGMIPVPHIATRVIPSLSVIDQWLYQLNRQALVDRALVIAGGNHEKLIGSFASSLELVRSNVLTDNDATDLRFAAHPEDHPLLTDAQLMQTLLEKQKVCDELGYKSSLVTQFFFDFASVAAWERRLRQYGINMPIRVGFHGAAGMAKLIKYAINCGVDSALNQLIANPSKMIKTTMAANPENLILDLAIHCNKHTDNLFSGCHFFPFGNFERTADWLRQVEFEF